MQPLALIRAAIKAVPAVKYALGVAGIFAVVAIISAFGLDPRIAAGGSILILVLMVVLVIFAKLTSIAPRYFLKPALVLTWAFLLVTVATAVLLFTSVFFGTPLDVKALVQPARTNSELGTIQLPEPDLKTKVQGAIAAARFQMDSGSYSDAWKSIESVQYFPEVERFKTELAQSWLRNAKIRVGSGETFAGLVQPLVPVLVAASKSTNKQQAADALAHLGYANHLRRNESGSDDNIQSLYAQAVQIDPENVYAHTFWGTWELRRGSARLIDDARRHFELAMHSGRERGFVRQFQLAALRNMAGAINSLVEMVRVLNEMRKAGESLSKDQKQSLASYIYYPDVRLVLADIQKAVSNRDHLATYHWLVDDGQPKFWDSYVIARLTEEAGQPGEALTLYQKLTRDSDFKRFVYSDEILEGISRCEAVVAPR